MKGGRTALRFSLYENTAEQITRKDSAHSSTHFSSGKAPLSPGTSRDFFEAGQQNNNEIGGDHRQTRKIKMKTKHLLVAAIAVVSLNVIEIVQAAEPLLSPRAAENRIRVVPKPSVPDPNLLRPMDGLTLSPRARENQTRAVAKMDERNLVREQRGIIYTGKNPLRDLRPMPMEIAVVK
jgi:hypothetical protein